MLAKPPIAKQVPFTVKRHQHVRSDEYRWIRDTNWKKICEKGPGEFANPEILDYIKAENAYTQEVMGNTESLQKTLYDELIGRLKETDSGVPYKYGPYHYYHRTEKGKNYPLYCRKLNGREEVYMDVNKDAEPYDQYSLGALSISEDHTLAAYTFNLSGSLSNTLKVRDLTTGEDRSWSLPDLTGSICWSGDSQHLYYVARHPENGRGYQVYLLDITAIPEDATQPPDSSKKLLYTKPDELSHMFISLGKTSSREIISINVADHCSNQLYLLGAHDVTSQPLLMEPVQDNVMYDIDHFGGYLYVHTNVDGATNFKVMRTPLDSPGRVHWEEFIPHCDDTFIASTDLYCASGAGFLIRQVTYNDQALARIVIRNLETNAEHSIDIDEEAYDLAFSGSREFFTETVRYTYESPVQPIQTIAYNLVTREREVLKAKEVPNYDPSLYRVHRRFAIADDGAEVPITIVFHKDTKLDGSAPAFVYGYGAYAYGMTPYFSANRISLLDRGFVFAIAHVRGGDDKGYGWYLDGKLDKKKNTFLDFISCCQYLIDQGYTAQGNIVANGGSAGGMLMGAIANMRPDLFRAVIANVAFVDVINTMEDSSLPLTESEWNEWGNPLEDEEAYHYMLSYSPYDNVVAQNYPHMLFNSGISDEQVTYWEPTKMVARLRRLKTDNKMLLLKVKMTSGHSGASKRYQAYEELAFDYAFALKSLED